jgi:hypothetical protein
MPPPPLCTLGPPLDRARSDADAGRSAFGLIGKRKRKNEARSGIVVVPGGVDGGHSNSLALAEVGVSSDIRRSYPEAAQGLADDEVPKRKQKRASENASQQAHHRRHNAFPTCLCAFVTGAPSSLVRLRH